MSPSVPPSTELDIRQIPIGELKPSPTNPRRVRDAKADDELAANVKQFGVLQPILVRPLAKGGFEVIAGERRFRAAKAAGLDAVPSRVMAGLSDEQVLELQIVENLQRKDIHPLDEADGFAQLHERYDVAQIAAKLGKSAAYVYQRISLTKVAPAVRKHLETGTLGVGHGILLARLTPQDQAAALTSLSWAMKEGRELSIGQLREWIARNVNRDLATAPWAKDDAELVAAAGPCSKCPKRSGATPELFENLPKKDTCFDPACFAKKLAAQIARTKKDLEAKGEKVVKVSEVWSAPEGAIRQGGWKKAGKGDKDAVKAIVVDGKDVGKVVSAVVLKSAQPKSTYDPKKAAEEQKKREAKFAAKKKQEQLGAKRVEALVAATMAKAPASIDVTEWRTIVVAMWSDIDAEHLEPIVRRLRWKAPKNRWQIQNRDFIEKQIAKADAKTCVSIVRELGLLSACADEFGGINVEDALDPKAPLVVTAKRYGVDVEAVLKPFEEKPKEPKPAKGKAKPAAKPPAKKPAKRKAA